MSGKIVIAGLWRTAWSNDLCYLRAHDRHARAARPVPLRRALVEVGKLLDEHADGSRRIVGADGTDDPATRAGGSS
ncbi:hypothetical protein ACVCAH_05740 [Micromonospora sp. LZ34]